MSPEKRAKRAKSKAKQLNVFRNNTDKSKRGPSQLDSIMDLMRRAKK